jgi:hypothetical protein
MSSPKTGLGTNDGNRSANVSVPKDKKNAPAAGSPIQKQKRIQEKLIRLDDLIPKGKVSGGRQLLFGATDINQTTNRTRKGK